MDSDCDGSAAYPALLMLHRDKLRQGLYVSHSSDDEPVDGGLFDLNRHFHNAL